ncbi:hypothetical protein U1Q18_000942 [Sarracenia purpurea var. burkii]
MDRKPGGSSSLMVTMLLMFVIEVETGGLGARWRWRRRATACKEFGMQGLCQRMRGRYKLWMTMA